MPAALGQYGHDDRLRFPHAAALPDRRQEIIDRIRAVVCAGDSVAVLGVTPPAGPFRSSRPAVQQNMEVLTDNAGELFEPFVSALSLRLVVVSLGYVADGHEDALERVVVDPVPQRHLDPADRPVVPPHLGPDRP